MSKSFLIIIKNENYFKIMIYISEFFIKDILNYLYIKYLIYNNKNIKKIFF